MLEARIRKFCSAFCLTSALFGVATVLSSCATEKPKQTALVSDPDARAGTSIPWNKPANWEGRGNLPGGLGNGQNDPFGQSGYGGTGGY